MAYNYARGRFSANGRKSDKVRTGANSGSFLTKSNSDEVLTNHATPIRCVKAIQEAGGPDLTNPKK